MGNERSCLIQCVELGSARPPFFFRLDLDQKDHPLRPTLGDRPTRCAGPEHCARRSAESFHERHILKLGG